MDLKVLHIAFATLILSLGASVTWGSEDLDPLSISLFALYGTPVQPTSLGFSNYDGLGWDFLAEYHPTRYASLGLGYETATFYGTPNLTAGTLNLEGRFFPMAGWRLPYDPYVVGEAGLNLSSATSTQWGGAYALKAGLGTQVAFVGPLSLDFAIESHWMGNSPNFFQYVDFRMGLDFALPMKNPQTPTPTAAPTAAAKLMISPTPSEQVTQVITPLYMTTPTNTPTPVFTDTPTPQPVIQDIPGSRMKKYYSIGTKAFAAGNYKKALVNLKKAVAIKESVKYYYYAESYATIAVIYQFHSTVRGHLRLALENYKKAAKIDPDTMAVKLYYKKLKDKLSQSSSTAPVENGIAATASPAGSNLSINPIPAP